MTRALLGAGVLAYAAATPEGIAGGSSEHLARAPFRAGVRLG